MMTSSWLYTIFGTSAQHVDLIQESISDEFGAFCEARVRGTVNTVDSHVHNVYVKRAEQISCHHLKIIQDCPDTAAE